MKSVVFVLILLMAIVAVPAMAADRSFELKGFAIWVDPNSNGTFNSSTPNQPFNIDFKGDLGYGIGANIFFGQALSLELTASEVRPEVTFPGRTRPSGSRGNSNLKMIPLTAVLQWHFAPNGFIDPYIGGGAAYILFDNVSNVNDVSGLNLNEINFKDDVGFAANAGLSFRIAPSFAINVDGKYVPLRSSANAVFAGNNGTASSKVKINPVMFSAGIEWRF